MLCGYFMYTVVSKKIPKIVQLIGTCLHRLDERDSPSKFRVSTPALVYKM